MWVVYVVSLGCVFSWWHSGNQVYVGQSGAWPHGCWDVLGDTGYRVIQAGCG